MLPLVTSDTAKIATGEELEGRQSQSVLLPLLFQNDTGASKCSRRGLHGGFTRGLNVHAGVCTGGSHGGSHKGYI
jgi:hypothetical protein